jgi:tetratricopeptide (TPR) repeat protein
LTFNEKLSFDADMQTAPLSEAETQYFLGDVLCRIQSRDEGEDYLKRAVALDPKLAPAYASLGISSLRRKQFAEARRQLEQAVAANSQNHLAHYYYAFTIYREIYGEGQLVTSLPEDKLKMMKASLDRAIQLAPDFPEPYNLLGFIHLATGENLGGGVNAVKKAMAIAPGREDYAMNAGATLFAAGEVRRSAAGVGAARARRGTPRYPFAGRIPARNHRPDRTVQGAG